METMSRVVAALVGVHVGILGTIIAAGSSEVSRQSGNAFAFGSLVWVAGLVLIGMAYWWPRDGPGERESAGNIKGPTS
jgi:hypothetical protein